MRGEARIAMTTAPELLAREVIGFLNQARRGEPMPKPLEQPRLCV
jgi:hypothetical protein